MTPPAKKSTTEADAVRLARQAAAGDDPGAGLRAVAALRRGLELLEAQHVDGALEAGWSWRRIAESIGVSRQAAHRKHAVRAARAADEARAHAVSGKRLVIVGAAREAVLLARHEAAAMSSRRVGTEHLLVGLVRQRTGTAADVLVTLGVSTEKARACAQAELDLAHGEPETEDLQAPGWVAPDRLPFSLRGRATLEQALREAVALGDPQLRTEHLLLALMRDPGSRAVRCLARLSITPAGAEDAVHATRAPRLSRT